MKTKIFFLHRSLNQSGAVRQLLYLYNALDTDRFDKKLILYRSDRLFYSEYAKRPDVWILRQKREPFFRCLLRFVALLKKEQPDIVQSFDPTSNALMYLASFFCRKPRYIASVRNTRQKRKHNLIDGFFQNRVESIIVNSKATLKELTEKAHIRSDKIIIIPNGIDTNRFKPPTPDEGQHIRICYEIPENTFVLLSVGRLHRQKNPLVIVQTMAILKKEYPELSLCWYYVGRIHDQKLYTRMNQKIREAGLESQLIIREPTHQITDYYYLSDLVVLASLWEGLPNVVLEAMACGRLVAASRQSDNDNIIRHAENGFSFNANDPYELASLIKHILFLSDEQKSQIIENARQSVVERFSLETMIRNFQHIYSLNPY